MTTRPTTSAPIIKIHFVPLSGALAGRFWSNFSKMVVISFCLLGVISLRTSSAALIPAWTAPLRNPLHWVAVSVPAQCTLTDKKTKQRQCFMLACEFNFLFFWVSTFLFFLSFGNLRGIPTSETNFCNCFQLWENLQMRPDLVMNN